MHLCLPPCVGDEDFRMWDPSTVYNANGGMPLHFASICWTQSKKGLNRDITRSGVFVADMTYIALR